VLISGKPEISGPRPGMTAFYDSNHGNAVLDAFKRLVQTRPDLLAR